MSFRTILVYATIGILFMLFYQYIWNDSPVLFQKIAIFFTAVFLFSFLKDCIFWIFSSITNFWGNILKVLILILAFFLSWFYIFTHFSNKNFKENHIAIRNDVRNFFALPTSSPFAKSDAIIVRSSSKETKNEDPLVTLLTQNIPTLKKTEQAEIVNNIQNFILKYSNDAEKNWKIAVQKELYTQEGFTFSKEMQSKINTKKYKPIASTKTKENAVQNNENYIYFKNTPVQVVYPENYAFKNIKYKTEENAEERSELEEEIEAEIFYGSERIADIAFKIYNSGMLYEKYKNEFITEPSPLSNIFFIESATLHSVQYVTFFAGNCWSITITKENENLILDDFYALLLPAVFEAQE